MSNHEKLVPTYLGESIAVLHGTVKTKGHILKAGVIFCQYPEGAHFSGEEDDTTRLVISVAIRNNGYIRIITGLTNALNDESAVERLAYTTSVDEVLEPLAGRKQPNPTLSTWRRWD